MPGIWARACGSRRTSAPSSCGSTSEIERRDSECPSAALLRLANTTGACYEWLKHGIDHPYPVRNASLEDAVEALEELEPERIYLCLELRSFVLLFVARVTEHRWAVVDFGLTLDLWRWVDDHRYFPDIHRLLQSVHEGFYPRPYGRVLPEPTITELGAGRIYPKTAVEGKLSRLAPDGGLYWVEDVLDVRCHSAVAPRHDKSYGAWFGKLQGEFRRYL